MLSREVVGPSAAFRSALEVMVGCLFFILAVTGYVTTSAVFHKGKRAPFRKLRLSSIQNCYSRWSATLCYPWREGRRLACMYSETLFEARLLILLDAKLRRCQDAPIKLANHCQSQSAVEIRIGDYVFMIRIDSQLFAMVGIGLHWLVTCLAVVQFYFYI